MKERARRVLGRLALVLLGLTLAVALGEIALRLFLPTYTPIAMDLFRRGPDGLLRLAPGERRRHVSPEWDVPVVINSWGFRDAETLPRDGQRVILALGDSMTFGWGVALEETYPSRVERALPDTRVIKAGIPATGPTDQLALLGELLPRFHPDTVVLGFWVGNDFQDVAEGGAAAKDVIDGLLFPRGTATTSRRFSGWLKRRSYLAQLAAQGLWLLERRRAETVPVTGRAHPGLEARDANLRSFVSIHLKGELPAELARGVTDTLTTLDAIRELCRATGVRFVLLVLPRSVQVHDEDRTRYEKAFGIEPSRWDLDRPQRILAEWARGKDDVALVDVLPAMRAAASTPLTESLRDSNAATGERERLFFFPDSHMNAAGHALVARELATRLKP